MWQPAAEGRVRLWSDVRPGFPEEPLAPYAPGNTSGTFDYFTLAINGAYAVSPDRSNAVSAAGYVPLPPVSLLVATRRLDRNVTGSIFGGRGSVLGVTAETFADEDQIKNALLR